MLTRRRERMLQLSQQAQANQLKYQASKKGAIAVLLIFAAIGFIAGWLGGNGISHVG